MEQLKVNSYKIDETTSPPTDHEEQGEWTEAPMSIDGKHYFKTIGNKKQFPFFCLILLVVEFYSNTTANAAI